MIKIGVAGLGQMGKIHLQNSIRSKNVKVTAVADLEKSNLKIVNGYKINTYTDYKKMIDSENLDALIISLPNFLKKESIIYCADKNLPIFIDKPMARNYEEAKEICKKVENTNTPIMVGVNYRYFDSVKKVKNKAEDGNLGEIILATSELILNGPFSHPYIPKPVPEWWFDKERSGGGALLDLGYHLLDMLTWMFGEFDVEFSTLDYRYSLPVEDSSNMVIKSRKSEVRGIISVGWYSKSIFPNFNFRLNLHGTAGYASTDQYAPRDLFRHAVKEGINNSLKRITFRQVNYLSYTYYYTSFYEIINLFFQNLEKGDNMPIDLEQQLSIFEIIDKIYQNKKIDKS